MQCTVLTCRTFLIYCQSERFNGGLETMATESNLAVQLCYAHTGQIQYHLQQWQDLFDTDNIPHSCLSSDPMEPLTFWQFYTRHKEPSAKTLYIGCEEQQGCPEPVLMESCRRSVTLELLHISVPSPQNSREEAVDVKGGSEGHSSARTLIPVHSAVFGH